MNDQDETRVFHDGEFHLEYTMTRTKRRTIGITIRSDASVIVRIPRHVAQRQVDDVLALKKGWIQKKRENIQARERSRPKPPEFSDGEIIPYIGQTLRLLILHDVEKRPRVEVVEGSLVVHIPRQSDLVPESQELVRVVVVGWYKSQARALLSTRVEVLKSRLGVHPARVAIKDQRTRWGSCSSKGNVNLNWRLILCPPSVMDYVVIHELCHLKVHSHSASFWKFVASLVPDYKAYKQWLESSGYLRDF